MPTKLLASTGFLQKVVHKQTNFFLEKGLHRKIYRTSGTSKHTQCTSCFFARVNIIISRFENARRAKSVCTLMTTSQNWPLPKVECSVLCSISLIGLESHAAWRIYNDFGPVPLGESTMYMKLGTLVQHVHGYKTPRVSLISAQGLSKLKKKETA